MKQWKKIIAAVLMCAMVVSLGGPLSGVSQAAMPTTEYFEETFSTDGSFDETWSADSADNLSKWAECVSEGKFSISGTNTTPLYLMADDDVLRAAADYIVSCKIQFGNGELSKDTNISITSRATAANTTGYEFQLTVKKDGSALVGLRDRKASKYFVQNKSLENFDHTTENELKIKTAGNLVTCYINENPIFSCDISTTYKDGSAVTNIYSAGTTAIRMATIEIGVDVSFDDFKVYHAEDYKFCDDFNGYDAESTPAQKKQALEANDWYIASNPNAEYINGNAYVIPADSTTSTIVLQTENAKGALGWNDYSVEADITIGEGTLASAVYACVTGRHTVAGGNDGYEIRLYEGTDGTQELQIYARNKGSIIESCPFTFERGKVYNLKAVFQDDEIYAYVDSVLYLTATSDAYPIGYAGIRKIGSACGVEVTFDNFVVYDYDVTPATFIDDFSSYDNNTSGAANKNLMLAKGWNPSNNTQGNYNTSTSYKVPSNVNIDLQLTGVEGATEWSNYSVEATLQFLSIDTTAGVITAGIAGRVGSTGSDAGYDLVVHKSSLTSAGVTLKLRCNGSDISGASISIKEDFALDTRLTLKMVFDGTMIYGYLNDGYEIAYDTANDDIKYSCGYAGVKKTTKAGYGVTFDNFIVYDNDNPSTYVKEIVGDINTDTSVNAEDTTVIKDNLLSGTLDNTALDVNKNNATNIFDYVRMKRLVYSLEH